MAMSHISTDSPYPLPERSLSDPNSKLETYQALSRLSLSPRLPVIESLLVLRREPRPLFLCNSASGHLQVTSTNAVEAFFRATISLHLTESFLRPSPYRVPGYVLHTRTEVRLALDPEEARRLMETEAEFLMQRFVAPADFVVRKMRVEWSESERLRTQLIERRSPMPFNAPKVPEALPARRKFSLLAVQSTQERPRRRSQLQPATELLNPDLFKGAKRECEDRAWEKDYFVSFRHSANFQVREVGLFDRVSDAGDILAFFQPENSGVPALKLHSLTIDLVQRSDGRWAFLAVKELKYRETTLAAKPPLHKTLDEIKTILSADLSTHKMPTIRLEEIQSRNVELYLRLLDN